MTVELLWFMLLGVLLGVLIVLTVLRVRASGRSRPGLEHALRDEFRQGRAEAGEQASTLRQEIARQQHEANALLAGLLQRLGSDQDERLDRLARGSREQGDRLVDAVARLVAQTQAGLQSLQASNEKKLGEMQTANERRLEAMRQLVDEKLQSTLEKRLGESFRLVSERLEAVQRGLGEMQALATGVGDLKRVLVNVKERGTWGEYQLGAILADILTPDQYGANVRITEGREVVEYAVTLPGRKPGDGPVWLPIDAKFPKESYERLVEASLAADADGVQRAAAELRATVLKMAQEIQRKYICPPASTDFAILFLPTEGLFAEVLRLPGLHDEIQQRCRVLIAGPTTLAAILNSLRVGFQTLAIEQRASEVWQVLGAVKTEFGVFAGYLDRVRRHVQLAANTLDQSARRTRAMERRLQSVAELSRDEAAALLDLPDVDADTDGSLPAANSA